MWAAHLLLTSADIRSRSPLDAHLAVPPPLPLAHFARHSRDHIIPTLSTGDGPAPYEAGSAAGGALNDRGSTNRSACRCPPGRARTTARRAPAL